MRVKVHCADKDYLQHYYIYIYIYIYIYKTACVAQWLRRQTHNQ